MATPKTDEWFLDVEGQKSGPFTAEQVRDLFRDGEVLGYHLVSNSREGASWRTVEEFVNGHNFDSDVSSALFDTLQVVRGRVAQTPAKTSTTPSSAAPLLASESPEDFGNEKNQRLLKTGSIALGLVLIAWGAWNLWNKKSDSPPSAEAVQTIEMPDRKAEAPRSAPAAPAPAAPAAQNPSNPFNAQHAAPSRFAAPHGNTPAFAPQQEERRPPVETDRRDNDSDHHDPRDQRDAQDLIDMPQDPPMPNGQQPPNGDGFPPVQPTADGDPATPPNPAMGVPPAVTTD